MAAYGSFRPKTQPAPDRFYVVQAACASADAIVTVLHQVPGDARELGSFDDPNRALEFAETMVRRLRETGVAVELVDPPYGLVGAG